MNFGNESKSECVLFDDGNGDLSKQYPYFPKIINLSDIIQLIGSGPFIAYELSRISHRRTYVYDSFDMIIR